MIHLLEGLDAGGAHFVSVKLRLRLVVCMNVMQETIEVAVLIWLCESVYSGLPADPVWCAFASC